MNCANCGFDTAAQTYCPRCGSFLTATKEGFPPVLVKPEAPQPQAPVPLRKRSWRGPIVFLVVLLLLLGGLGYYYATIALLPPKNLGITYSQADADSAFAKAGVTVTVLDASGNNIALPDGKTFSYNDFSWQFLQFTEKTVELTPAEATAFFNQLAPGVNYFSQLQINTTAGELELSAKLDATRLEQDLFQDIMSQIPFSAPDHVNLYLKGSLTITENRMDLQPSVLSMGELNLTSYVQGENQALLCAYLERLYTVTVPGMELHSVTITPQGTLLVTGNLPQSVIMTKKG